MRKIMKEKMTMFFAALLFVLVLAPAVKAEAYGVKQIAAGTNDATISWDADTDSKLQKWNVYVNGSLLTSLPANSTSFQLTGLTQGCPYAVQVTYIYKYSSGTEYEYNEGSVAVRTIPNKVKKTQVVWGKTDYIDIYALDADIYETNGQAYLYADGFEIVVKDKNGKTKQTFDSYNYTSYGGAHEWFKAPSALVNKGMQYTVRPYIKIANDQKVYGEAITEVAVPQAKVNKIKKVSSSKYKITWKKISGATGYTIYRTSNSGNSVKKIKKVSKNTTSYIVNKSYMNSNKKGIIIVANGVKIAKKKYNSIKSYYTYTY